MKDKHASLRWLREDEQPRQPWSPKTEAKRVVREALREVIDELLKDSQFKRVETVKLRESLAKLEGSTDFAPILDEINRKLDSVTANVSLERDVLERLKAKLGS